MDDEFMTKCFEDNKECIELVLRIILNKSDLEVRETRTQYNIQNLQGRSVRLDIYATDSTRKKYNIEVQKADKGAGAQRARYNSSLIDANSIFQGDTVDELPETYVIFITEHDVLGKGKAIYHIDRYIKETGDIFGDGTHILYVNGEHRDSTPLGKLMHDFSCRNPADMYYAKLAERVKYFKEEDGGVGTMSKIVEDLINDVVGEEKRESAINMLKDGVLPLEKIASYLSLPLEEVKKIAELQVK